jgi:hypothetical protein
MKVIAVVKRSKGNAFGLLRHCYLAEGRSPTETEPLMETDDRVVGIISGLNDGIPTRHATTDARSLLGDASGGKAEVRHVVLSVEDTQDPIARARSFEALAAMGEQFASRFAPEIPWIGIIHEDRAHPHIHLVFKNETEEMSALTWNRDDLKCMQSMEWISPETRQEFSIEAGRSGGRTQRQGTGLPYPLASLDALKLAAAALQELENYESADLFSIKRRSPSGEPQSIKFNNRTISLSTIRQLAKIRRGMGSPARPHRSHCRRSRLRGGPSIS